MGVGWYAFALHEEGVGVQTSRVAEDDPVVDEGAGADGAVVADGDVAGLEDAVLQGVGLEGAARVEGAVVADAGEGALDDAASVVEDPAADAYAEQAPDGSA
ncbi:hypothetical protein GCM10020000_04490 [Streptomyces olivoverticillatus]